MKIQLSENQIKSLISGYKVLNEQSAPGFNPETKTEEINFSSVWGAGYYKMTSKQISAISKELSKIRNFLVKNPQTKLTIQVEAGESKVTNADNEKGGIPVKEGYLSQKRGESMVGFLTNYFKKLTDSGLKFTQPSLPKPKTIVGGPRYTRGTDNPKDPKYTPFQFVKLKITATSKSECLIGLDVMIAYLGKGGHDCDEAIFELRMNGVSLGVANLNNGTKDVRGFNPSTKPLDPLRIVKAHIKRVNTESVSGWIRKERAAAGKWRKQNPNSSIMDYEYDGKTIREYGGMERWYQHLRSISGENAEKITYTKESIFDEEFKNKLVTMMKKYGVPHTNSLSMYNRVVGASFGFDPDEALSNGQKLHERLTNMPGRNSDGKQGGTRSQTFTIDTAKAQEIFKQGKVSNNKIILSIVPLVSATGPYRQYYSKGSHSDVPFVKISKKGEKEARYRGYPSVNISRGSLEEKDLITTDLCGNKITTEKK